MSDTEAGTIVRINIKEPSLWKVVFHNDAFTPMEFVVQILIQIFNKNIEEAEQLMMHVHENGKAIIGLYTKEVATTKVILTMRTAENHGHPLLATAEEA